MKKILIDCSLTGGRGPVKKTAEFVWACQDKKIHYILLTDNKLAPLLKQFNIKPDFIVNTNLNRKSRQIYSNFNVLLKTIKFDFLVKFGARTPGPYFARINNIPYIIVDGGLPDKFETWPSLYDAKTYYQAVLYILTTNLPYRPDYPLLLNNLRICYFPISPKTQRFIENIKRTNKTRLINKISNYLTPFPSKYDFILNLNITNDYVQENSRITYGAWLSAKQYDQVVGFLRRLITDISTLLNDKKIIVIADNQISRVCLDLYTRFSNIYPITWKKQWNYYAEIILDAISDITIARAANYQPYIFALSRGNNITTAVPADGYMNEDAAAIQAQALNLTTNISYDDEQYVNKLCNFFQDKNLINKISNCQKTNFKKFGQQQNTIGVIFNCLKNYI